MKKVDLKVICWSKGRTSTIRNHTLKFFPGAIVTVDESEMDDYAKVVPREQLMPHPSFPMVGKIGNWILDTVDADFLVIMDDDIFKLWSMVGWRPRTYTDPAVAWAVLENAAVCAGDAGCGLFGFNQRPNVVFFDPQKPINLAAWVGSIYGFVRGHGLRWDERMAMHDDIDLSLQSLVKQRIIWNDWRWCFENLRIGNTGGLSAYRSAERYRAEDGILKEKWGRYVSVGKQGGFRGKNNERKASVGTVTQLAVRRTQGLGTAAE